ncbi:hypothetical protein [Listeria grayi]|uniref:hypothetical protein n=1 Tax=Listeria grayi TaxID=1641 RepID=UPI0016275D22|nr:hypothetical protein [Listeria grayi]MBC1922980.1 hypothetical protein [Listeria grayi]
MGIFILCGLIGVVLANFMFAIYVNARMRHWLEDYIVNEFYDEGDVIQRLGYKRKRMEDGQSYYITTVQVEMSSEERDQALETETFVVHPNEIRQFQRVWKRQQKICKIEQRNLKKMT